MKHLKVLREKANLSVKELAIEMHVTQQAVGKWERGESYPRAEQLPKLAGLLNCTIDALFGREQSTA